MDEINNEEIGRAVGMLVSGSFILPIVLILVGTNFNKQNLGEIKLNQ